MAQDYFGNNISPDGVSAPPNGGNAYTPIDPAVSSPSSSPSFPAQTPPPAPPAAPPPPPPSYTDSFLGGGNSIKAPLPTVLPTSNQSAVNPDTPPAPAAYGETPPVPAFPQGDVSPPPPPSSPSATSEQPFSPQPNQYGVPPVAQAPTPPSSNASGWAQQNPASAQSTKNKSGLYLFIVIFLLIAAAGVVYFFFLRPAEQTMMESPAINMSDSKVSTVSVAENRDGARKKDLADLQTALEQYYIKNGLYPLSPDVSPTQDGATPLSALVPDFLPALPVDPGAPEVYYGYKSTDGKTYTLTALFDAEPTGVQSTKTESGNFQVVLSAGVNIATN